MAVSGMQSNKQMKRMESKKSHSWWWDSHISPKNSKWLSENLVDMDRSVKQMLKLIEEDGDSFAKKAEMYYKKRPELIAHVEEFYRMYRFLAERYDHLTGELRRYMPSDLQSQGSMSDFGSEPPSTCPSPPRPSPPPRWRGSHRSRNRAAGFDFFLGSGGNGSDVYQKEGYESSTLTDSEEESDDSSVNNYSVVSGNGNGEGVNRKMMELEMELREVKEKLLMLEEENADGSDRGGTKENAEDIHVKINGYEQELRILNEKLRLSEEEVTNLKIELQRYRSLESANLQAGVVLSPTKQDMETEGEAIDVEALELQGSIDDLEQEISEQHSKVKSVVDELRITKAKLEVSEKQIASLESEAIKSSERIKNLQDQLDSARKDTAAWKSKFNSEKRESTKLQERIARLKTSLSDRDNEIRDLKTEVSDAEQKIFPEKAQLKTEMSKLLEERTSLQEQIREWECRGRCFEEEIRKINSEKRGMEKTLKGEIELLKADILERDNIIKDMTVSLDALKLERDHLKAEVGSLKGELNTKDEKIEKLDEHLNLLQMEHKQLIAGMEEASRRLEEMKSRAKQLEEEAERQTTLMLESAEEKREAIRQLCFSLEHYRNENNRLRKALTGNKRVPVLVA
ncbi:hypothetical protein L6164_030927 [Bauhinia variegata]|uniref:Uncharacterized protein n=1 Tax=Bauhinia variegata TaxID=167791 RepID=A0ACB9LDV6_BAUVA|nr:hypothetical protein L6164_030927 [Bauhinia variegata]